MRLQFIPKNYVNYYYASIIEDYGIMGGIIILTWLPIVAFLLSFLMLRKRNMPLFYTLLGGFFLINGFMIATHRSSLFKTNLSAVLVLLVAVVYWLVMILKDKRF